LSERRSRYEYEGSQKENRFAHMVSTRVEYNPSFSDSKCFCSVVKIITKEDTERD